MNGEPTLQEIKTWLKLTDLIDDVPLEVGRQAALAYQATNLAFPVDEAGQPYYTEDLKLAVYLRTARYLHRRNSPTGLEGFSEFGPVQIALSDRDVANLESAYLRHVTS